MANYGEAKQPRSDPFSKGEEREEKFQRIFRRHYRSVTCFFAHRGFDTEECRDLTQETFFRVFRGMEGFRGEAGIKTWLYTIAANIYRNEIRDRQAEKRCADEVSLDEAFEHGRPVFESCAVRAPAVSQDPLRGVLTDERARLLREAVDDLPPRMRHCVLLRLDRGLKYREIAVLLQVTEDTVKAQLFQARQRLYRILGGHFRGFDFN
jgi:RNA polymerase sigma-70 factor (ECF subfamily)